MSNMRYHWYDTLKAYFYRMKRFGKVIYNYDDPAEFGLVIDEEQPVKDPHPHVDMDMANNHHEDDET